MAFGEGYKPKKDLTFKDERLIFLEKIEKASKMINNSARMSNANVFICSNEFVTIFNNLKV